MIPGFLRPRLRAARGALGRCGALGLAAAAAWLLPVSGCMGGTTSEGGNPGITLEFTRDGKPARYSGFIQIVAKDSNPAFFRTPPQDGTTSPSVIVGGAPAISLLVVSDASSITFDWDDLARSMYAHAELPLAKASAAAAGSLPDFNVILIGKDSLAGWLQGVRGDPSGGPWTAGGESGSTFKVEVAKERRYSGEVDTAGPAGKPLALFVPGTPYFAPIRAGRFTFEGMPSGIMPLRWLSANGRVHAVAESLDTRNPSSTQDTLPGRVTAGALLDSVPIPAPNPVLEPPVAVPAGLHAFTDSVRITLAAEAGAAIHYTLDGAEPDLNSPAYTKPIVLRSSATLKAFANRKGKDRSPVTVNNYVLVPPPPVASPAGGLFRDSVRVTLAVPAAGAKIHYTLDGSEPTAQSTVYLSPILIAKTSTLKAAAALPGLGMSAVTSHLYSNEADTAVPPAPLIYPTPGSFRDSVVVTLTASVPGAKLYYTFDGTSPSPAAKVYGSPLVLFATTTIKAIAVAPGGRQSEVLTALYTLSQDTAQALAAPVASPPAGSFLDTLRVTLASPLPGSVIHYTLDGSAPSAASVIYGAAPIVITATTTLKAVSRHPQTGMSAVMTAVYVLSDSSSAMLPRSGF